MASRHSRHSGALGVGTEGSRRVTALEQRTRALPAAANDNKAPLLLKVRRLVFLSMAALALAWLFWAGLLR